MLALEDCLALAQICGSLLDPRGGYVFIHLGFIF